MATEIEMKLAFDKHVSEPQTLALEALLKSIGCDYALSEKSLQNAYFDTPEFQLNKNKVALRIRRKKSRQGDDVYIQTFKTAGKSENGLSHRGEWEWYLTGNKLDLAVLQQCEAWPTSINMTSLMIVFETNFTRFLVNIEWNESLIELVLDWGLILSNGKQERIHEIELELKQGNIEDLKAFANCLKKKLPLHASDLSKAERGFRLFQAD